MSQQDYPDKWVRQLYHPSRLLFLAECIFCVAAILIAFATGNNRTPLAYVLYAFTTYVLGVGIYLAVRKYKKLMESEEVVALMNDDYAVSRIFLILDLVLSAVYAAVLIVSGLVTESPWMRAAGGYYVFVGIVCYILVKGRISGEERDEKDDLKRCLIAGVLMVLLAFVVITLVQIAITGHQAVEYPGVMIYAAALATFVFFGSAVSNMVRYRGFTDPLMCTVKRFRMNKALYSMFVLQLAMFSAFGSGVPAENMLNIAVGTVVCVTVTAISAYQLIGAYMAYRQL